MAALFVVMDEPDQQERFRQLYQKHNPAMYAYAWELMRRAPHLTEDALQDAWVGILPYLNKIYAMSEQGARAYLQSAVKHSALKLLAKEPPKAVSLQTMVDNVLSGPDILDALCDREAVQRLTQVILSLPDAQREVLYCHYLCGMSYRQMAAHLHLSYTSVYKRFKKGKICLMQKLLHERAVADENNK